MSANERPAAKRESIIGTCPPRVEAGDKVTGRSIYGPDVVLPRMAHGAILRSPHAHARIRSVDTRRAEALPGVLAVVTAKDMRAGDEAQKPESTRLKYLRDNNLAGDKVLYVGHAIAAVAAISVHVAEEACRLIDIDFEVLPPVTDVLEAMRPDAPLLHERMLTRSLAAPATRPSNVASHFRQLKGDPERGFAEADVVIEREMRTAPLHQGYLEPHATTAAWGRDGGLTLYTTTQGSHDARSQIVDALALPAHRVRVVPTEVGGAFGGKNAQYVDVAAALLARRADCPVRIVMSRADVMQGTGPALGSVIRLQVGARRDGTLAAVRSELYFEAGAYPGSSVEGASDCMLSPYEIPNALVDGYDVVVNKPKTCFYRAPGAPQGCFAIEIVLDEMAEKLGIDPIELRLRNAAHEGTERVSGEIHSSIACEEVLRAALAQPHYRDPLGGPNRGRGVALGYWPNWGARSSATVNVNDDGTIALITGSVDIAGTRTSMAMMAAEVLGVPMDSIHSTTGDTETTGRSDSTGGSRTTLATGVAVTVAAQDAIAQMKECAGMLWGVRPEEVAYDRGILSATTPDGPQSMTFAEAAAQAPRVRGPIRGNGDVNVLRWGGAFGAHIVDVEVDPETGSVRVVRYTAVQDVGRVIHPSLVEGQIHGGVAQGIGMALFEGYVYDGKGRMLNPGFLDYKMPTFLDVPPIQVVTIDSPWKDHPFGVRGVGEVPIVPPAAAIANAIHAATGARLTELPMTPERVLRATGGLSSWRK